MALGSGSAIATGGRAAERTAGRTARRTAPRTAGMAALWAAERPFFYKKNIFLIIFFEYLFEKSDFFDFY